MLTKNQKIRHLDTALVNLEKIADRVGYHIDSDPDYIELVRLSVSWQYSELRMNRDLRTSMELLHRAVVNRVYAV
jgi:hypothetical protein